MEEVAECCRLVLKSLIKILLKSLIKINLIQKERRLGPNAKELGKRIGRKDRNES